MAEDLYWSVTDEGLNDAEAFFEYAGYKSRDMRDPLGEVQDYIQTTIEEQFDSEGERSGGWERLRPRYEAWKIIRAPGEPILRLTHEMQEIVEADSSWHLTMDTLIYDPPSEKAGWHQVGAYRTRGGYLPPRPILELYDVDYEEFADIFVHWLDDLRFENARRGDPSASLRPPIFL